MDLSGRMALMIRWGCEIYPVEQGPREKVWRAGFHGLSPGVEQGPPGTARRLPCPDQPCTGFSSWLCTSRALAMLVLSSYPMSSTSILR